MVKISFTTDIEQRECGRYYITTSIGDAGAICAFGPIHDYEMAEKMLAAAHAATEKAIRDYAVVTATMINKFNELNDAQTSDS